MTESKIAKIVSDIRSECLSDGQKALLDITKRLDGVELKSFIFNVRLNFNDEPLKKAINIAIENITKCHTVERDNLMQYKNNIVETSNEVLIYRKFTPIESVGIYVPNGLFSTLLMTVIPAKLARCNNIIVCTPPNPSDVMLYVCSLLGVDKIYTIGGAQAVFAMAYGIGEIPKVSKIFGPGNEYVDAAKKLVSNETAIDMPAGPSEVLIVSDGVGGVNYRNVLHSLLAQLEHGKESRAWLFCTDKEFLNNVTADMKHCWKGSERANILEHSHKNFVGKFFKTIPECIRESNAIAPEHLMLSLDNAEQYCDLITNAGSVFVGKYTTEALGDYIGGGNHVLPTSGFAKAFSGLSVASFGKFVSFQTATKDGVSKIANDIRLMAEAEGLEYHAKSAMDYI